MLHTLLTIQKQLELTSNRPSGFDYLRIILSIAVIAWHTVIVCYGRSAESPFWTGPLRPLVYFIVPGFFALSGFLVAGSLERNDLPSFLTLRCLRIFPALVVEVALSALIIGPLFTVLPLSEYFSDPQFMPYFLNMIGDIHFALPGVFGDLPAGPVVNLQLWTVPHELECYIVISLVSITTLYRRPYLLGLGVAAACLLMFLKNNLLLLPINLDQGPKGTLIVLCFLAGVVIYALREKVPFSKTLFLTAVLVGWICLDFRELAYLTPFPVAYIIVFIGLQSPRRLSILRGADYSYGIYLYGFPVQQTVSSLFPDYRIWYINLIVSLIISGAFAALSWHLVEAKVMERKKIVLIAVSKMKRRFVGAFGQTS